MHETMLDNDDDDDDGSEDDDDGEEVVGTELALAPSLEPHSQWWAPTSLGPYDNYLGLSS